MPGVLLLNYATGPRAKLAGISEFLLHETPKRSVYPLLCTYYNTQARRQPQCQLCGWIYGDTAYWMSVESVGIYMLETVFLHKPQVRHSRNLVCPVTKVRGSGAETNQSVLQFSKDVSHLSLTPKPNALAHKPRVE